MIEIRIHGETGAEARQKMADLLGLPVAEPSWRTTMAERFDEMVGPSPTDAPGGIDRSSNVWTVDAGEKTETEAPAPAADALAVRPRGKPASGSGRRTKVEIAEDDELERLAGAAKIKLEAIDEHIAKGVSREQIVDELNAAIAKMSPAEEPKPAISSGEERVDPAEVAAQDAADEKAESNAAREPDKLTHDDIRGVLGAYVKKYGMAAAQADGPIVISKVCGEGVVKISDVPDDKIADVMAGVNEMLAKNPFSREAA